MYICRNEIYAANPVAFASEEEFQVYSREAFGEEPSLRARSFGAELWDTDEDGQYAGSEPVLVRVDEALTGVEAMAVAAQMGLTLRKYEDPTEGYREGLSLDEAWEVAREDISLIHLQPEDFR